MCIPQDPAHLLGHWKLGESSSFLLCPVWSRLCWSLLCAQGWGTPYTVILGWLLVARGDEDDEGQGRGNQCDQCPDWEDALDLVEPICTWWGEVGQRGSRWR